MNPFFNGLARRHGLTALVVSASLMSACAVKPPLQEMSEARSVVKLAHEMQNSDPALQQRLQAADSSLEEATKAIQAKLFETAKRKALAAKREANSVIRILNSEKK
ncbi:MAG: hypothetical protein HQM07_00405 [Zetaproteobacteria bacterium]|nr:hypothetical protein [Zetaproteobacteria bacterium]